MSSASSWSSLLACDSRCKTRQARNIHRTRSAGFPRPRYCPYTVALRRYCVAMPASASVRSGAIDAASRSPGVPPFARGPVLSAMAALAVVLTATSDDYGYHRDELYFRMLEPAWGYVDEPPLTPFLARLATQLADEAWALRIPATLATVLSVYVVVLVTRELGGGRPAQALCAWGYAFASLPLIMGHVLLTSTLDLVVWPAVLLFVIRAQLRHQPQWWLAAGLVVGASMYNKLLVAILLLALAGALALVGPQRLIWSKWVLAAAALGLAVGSPNLVYQATHDWPQLSMGAALADENGSEVRILMWPFLLLILGPPLVPVWVAGLVSLYRRPEWAPVRFVAVAFPILLVLVFVMASQLYYPFGLLAVLFAAGCAALESRMAGRDRTWLVALVALNASVSMVLGLPLIPVSQLGETPVGDINQIARDTVGWPTYVAQIAAVYARLPPPDRSVAVIVTSNYGEAGAIDRFGEEYSLPAVYSGHNQLYFQARPPESANVVVFVGEQIKHADGRFEVCSVKERLDNGVGVDSEEQGLPIAVCRNPVGGWRIAWPALQHYD